VTPEFTWTWDCGRGR